MHNMRAAQPYLTKVDRIFVQDQGVKVPSKLMKRVVYAVEEMLPLLT